MKERPILFSGEMVRAIVDGRKTQTRRIARLNSAGRVKLQGKPNNWHCEDPDASKACPYGQPGDRLWVRETWGLHAYVDDSDWCRASIKGLPKNDVLSDWQPDYRADWGTNQESCHWRPSIHMPRWASRILLDVVSVRVERLQQLTNNDAMCEGFDGWKDPAGECPDVEPWEQFASLWNKINASRATWASNPWVWVVEFGRVL